MITAFKENKNDYFYVSPEDLEEALNYPFILDEDYNTVLVTPEDFRMSMRLSNHRLYTTFQKADKLIEEFGVFAEIFDGVPRENSAFAQMEKEFEKELLTGQFFGGFSLN